MKPAPFQFHAPRTLDETLALLARYGEDARILAGGQSLVPLLNMRMSRPAVLVSINHCPELAHIRHEGAHLTIGALTRQIAAERSAEVQASCPLLAAALPYVGGMANRNRGTVCGSLAHADPLAELPAVAVALDAMFAVNGTTGPRDVRAEDFFLAELTTCIQPGEMLVAVSFPVASPGTRAAFAEVSNRRHGFAVVGVATQLELDAGGQCRTVRLAAVGAGAVPLRLREAEQRLAGSRLQPADLREAAALASAAADPIGDFHADAAYRKELVGTLAARAVRNALSDPAIAGAA